MFTPDMDAIKEWVTSGAMASDMDTATREGLVESQPELLRDVSTVFGTEAGRRFLTYLAKSTVLRAPADYRLGAGALDYANIRQGQNQIFALIVELKELGDNLERKQHANGQSADAGHVVDRDNGHDTGGGWRDFDRDGDIHV